ncbi:MAG: hypothetical protein ACRC10_13210 [Thermoguttaceae bacterium]
MKQSFKIVRGEYWGPEHWEGNLIFGRTPVKSLGNLKSVSGSVYLPCQDRLPTLGNLESVGGWLDLRFTAIAGLGNLKSVGGFLDLSFSKTTRLDNLESVGGNLDLSETPIADFGKLKSVGESLKLHYTKLGPRGNKGSLGNLETVGGDILFYGPYYPDAPSLRSVGGYIIDRGDQLELVDKRLVRTGIQVCTLPGKHNFYFARPFLGLKKNCPRVRFFYSF